MHSAGFIVCEYGVEAHVFNVPENAGCNWMVSFELFEPIPGKDTYRLAMMHGVGSFN